MKTEKMCVFEGDGRVRKVGTGDKSGAAKATEKKATTPGPAKDKGGKLSKEVTIENKIITLSTEVNENVTGGNLSKEVNAMCSTFQVNAYSGFKGKQLPTIITFSLRKRI